jgi:transposase
MKSTLRLTRWRPCCCFFSSRSKRPAADGLGSSTGLSGGEIPQPVREVIVHMHKCCRMSAQEIAPLIPSPIFSDAGVHVRTVQKVLEREKTTGSVVDFMRVARARKMQETHAGKLINIVTERPFLYLSEISRELESFCGVPYSPKLCYVELRRRGFTLKAMRRRAEHRNEALRFKYWEEMSDLVVHPWQVCFAGEVGQDGRGSRRRRGWGLRGEDVVITELLARGKHISVLALYGYSGFINFDYKEGGYKADDFLEAVRLCIIPYLQPYDKANPLPNSIFVLDNCQIHHTHEAELREMVEGAGAVLVFLAPYSPIDNPIGKEACHSDLSWRLKFNSKSATPCPPFRDGLQLLQGLLAKARLVDERHSCL